LFNVRHLYPPFIGFLSVRHYNKNNQNNTVKYPYISDKKPRDVSGSQIAKLPRGNIPAIIYLPELKSATLGPAALPL